MKTLLLAIITLLIAVVIGRYISGDPGFVVIGYGGKVVRLSFVLFIILLLATTAALYFGMRLLGRLLTLRAGMQHWQADRRRRRAQRALEQGHLALAAGDWPRAERLFSAGADPVLPSPAHFLGAAEAAHAQHQSDRRDRYLLQAQDTLPDSDSIVGVRRAAMLIDGRQFDAALALLRQLQAHDPQQPQVLRLLRDLYIQTGDWQAIIDELLPAMQRNRGSFAATDLTSLRRRAWCGLLAAAAADGIAALWARIAKEDRADPDIAGAYAAALARVGRNAEAEEILRTALRKQWSPTLIDGYGRLETADIVRQIDFAQSLLNAHPDDPALLLALGRLNHRQELWGAARSHLERLCALAPSPASYRLLGEVMDAMHDPAGAQRSFRAGLKLATDGNALAPLTPERHAGSSASAPAASIVRDHRLS